MLHNKNLKNITTTNSIKNKKNPEFPITTSLAELLFKTTDCLIGTISSNEHNRHKIIKNRELNINEVNNNQNHAQSIITKQLNPTL